MKEFVIDERSGATPIGELLRQAGEGQITLLDADGHQVGWIAPPEQLPPMTEEELEEIRRLSRSDPSGCITTAELLARLHALPLPE